MPCLYAALPVFAPPPVISATGQLSAVSLDTAQQRHAVIWSQDNLPSDWYCGYGCVYGGTKVEAAVEAEVEVGLEVEVDIEAVGVHWGVYRHL